MLVWSAFVDFFATAIAFAIKHLFLYCLRNSTQNKQKKKHKTTEKKKRKKKQDPWVGAIKSVLAKSVLREGATNAPTQKKKKKIQPCDSR